MLAKPFQITPAVVTPPIKLPPLRHATLAKPPRVISITSQPADGVPSKDGAVSPTDRDDAVSAFWDYQFLFVSQRAETTSPVALRVVDGAVPPGFPSGTYYLTGPGMFADDHGSTVHPLDGHGYLRAFVVDGERGEVSFKARYVRTEAHVEEHDAETDTWRFTHRGPFSVLKGGRRFGNTKVMKNVANTSVVSWGGKLLCLWEGGAPYEIEPWALDTVGMVDLIDGSDDLSSSSGGRDLGDGGVDALDLAAGLLRPILYGVFKMPPKRLLSHYKIDVERNRFLVVSCNAEDMLLPRSHFTFYEYDENFKLLQKQEFNIPDHLMIHDWAFTDTHYIMFANRIKLDILGSMTAVCGTTPMISALTLNPSKSTSPIYLLPRFPSSGQPQRDWRVPIEAPSQMWLIHVANAFQAKGDDGNLEIQIHASGCSYQWFNFHRIFGYNWQKGKLDPAAMNLKDQENELFPHIVKISITLDANDGSCQSCSVEPLAELSKPADFPIINPNFSGLQNTYIYAAASSGTREMLPHFPFDTVAKLCVEENTTQTWSVGARRFIGEPIFVPSNGGDEDDGYLLVIEYAVAIQRCYLVILDAKRIGLPGALVARLEVPRHLNFPLGFHGFWSPSKIDATNF